MKKIYLIAAIDEQNGIGKLNQLPWDLPTDLKYFRQKTCMTKDPGKQNAVIMGRKTWESIPVKYQPMPNRKNIVLSRSNNLKLPQSVGLTHSIEEAIQSANQLLQVESIFIIGGELIYKDSIQKSLPDKLFITHVSGIHKCDAFFPPIPTHYKLTSQSKKYMDNNHSFNFKIYTKQTR